MCLPDRSARVLRQLGVLGLIALAGALGSCGGRAPFAPTPVSPAPAPGSEPAPSVPTLKFTKYLAFGDSITEGKTGVGAFGYFLVTITGYPTKLEDLLTSRYTTQAFIVINAGLGGESTPDGKVRLPQAIRNNTPEVVLLLEGANDINQGNVSGAADNLRDMVRGATRQGVAVVLATLPPEDPAGKRGGGAQYVTDLNARIARVASDEQIPLADLYKAFGGDLGLLSADGLHPNESGYTVIAQTWFETIRNAYEQRSPPSYRHMAARELPLTVARTTGYTAGTVPFRR